MEWLNFHHLRYFWMVARKGGVRRAAEELHVSQPSISAQLRLLEESLGQKLFKRTGRHLVLTETGQLILNYADEIFSVGRELMSAVKQRPGKHPVRLNIGLTDAFPKLITQQILRAAFGFDHPVHIVCREGEIGPLLNQLLAHRLDIVLADEPATSSSTAKTFNHRLGDSGMTFCAVPALAKKLRRNFPKSLDGAPALLPSTNMGMRAALETWFDTHDVHPRLVGEFEDTALMEVCSVGGRGFTVVHSVIDRAALKHYGLRVIARVKECRSEFYAITAERRVKHPAAVAITEHAYTTLFAGTS
jgi:LysR family transcriptional regulator, transcriptional activator of nhaA